MIYIWLLLVKGSQNTKSRVQRESPQLHFQLCFKKIKSSCRHVSLPREAAGVLFRALLYLCCINSCKPERPLWPRACSSALEAELVAWRGLPEWSRSSPEVFIIYIIAGALIPKLSRFEWFVPTLFFPSAVIFNVCRIQDFSGIHLLYQILWYMNIDQQNSVVHDDSFSSLYHLLIAYENNVFSHLVLSNFIERLDASC